AQVWGGGHTACAAATCGDESHRAGAALSHRRRRGARPGDAGAHACAHVTRAGKGGRARRQGAPGAAGELRPFPEGRGFDSRPRRFRLRGRAGSCHLQKLFGTDGELEDEDFLSAVEDAENQFVIPGHASPSVVPVPPSGPHPSEPHFSEPHSREPHPSRPPTLRPLAGQGEHPVGLQGPPWRGAAPQDELDNDLFLAACRELEGPEVPVGAGAAPVPPGRREKPPWKCTGKENAQECGVPKKLRVAEELVPGSGGLQDGQGPLPSPKLVLRPSAAGACAPRPPPSMGEPGGCGGSVPAPGAACLRPVQAPLGRSSSSVPWTSPAQSCPQPRLPPRPPPGPPSSQGAPGVPEAPRGPQRPRPPERPRGHQPPGAAGGSGQQSPRGTPPSPRPQGEPALPGARRDPAPAGGMGMGWGGRAWVGMGGGWGQDGSGSGLWAGIGWDGSS
ncbi:hypothetical protein DV515_00019325, partial [Chloebia gouldiae]